MNYVLESTYKAPYTRALMFTGDGVLLSGQIDYPTTPAPEAGFPLVFIIHHAGCNTCEDYQHYADVSLHAGYAIFRWDKRGTGRSGAGGRGSTTQDAINAYKTALLQPMINHKQVVIIAQGCGTKMLGSAFERFAQHQKPAGVILVANRLDEKGVQFIDSELHIVHGANDWDDSQYYTATVAAAHNHRYNRNASHYVADFADRGLIDTRTGAFHSGALQSIARWLVG